MEELDKAKEKMAAAQNAMENHISNISNSMGYKVLQRCYAFAERHKAVRAVGRKVKKILDGRRKKKQEKALLAYVESILAVSYTHLDVYKRQVCRYYPKQSIIDRN